MGLRSYGSYSIDRGNSLLILSVDFECRSCISSTKRKYWPLGFNFLVPIEFLDLLNNLKAILEGHLEVRYYKVNRSIHTLFVGGEATVKNFLYQIDNLLSVTCKSNSI